MIGGGGGRGDGGGGGGGRPRRAAAELVVGHRRGDGGRGRHGNDGNNDSPGSKRGRASPATEEEDEEAAPMITVETAARRFPLEVELEDGVDRGRAGGSGTALLLVGDANTNTSLRGGGCGGAEDDAKQQRRRHRHKRRDGRRERLRAGTCVVLSAGVLLAVVLRGGLAPAVSNLGEEGRERTLEETVEEFDGYHGVGGRGLKHHGGEDGTASAEAGIGELDRREGDPLLVTEVVPPDDDTTIDSHNHHHMKTKHNRGKSHLAHDHSPDGSGDYSHYSCDSLYQRTDPSNPAMVCDFAKTCNGGDGIYAPVTFCNHSRSPREWALLLSAPLALWMIVLFRTLGSTAEEFFSPGLEMFSLRMGLPERFAGVTLLALGNGAPDVASTVNAILDDPKRGYLLAVGELTGAAMVIGTVVAGAVAWVAPGGIGVQFGGALVRDVLFFVLTMLVAYKCLEDNAITKGEVYMFGGMYLGYVLVVLAADLFHRKVVEPREREERRSRRREKKAARIKAAGETEGVEVVLAGSAALAVTPVKKGGAGGRREEEEVYPERVDEMTGLLQGKGKQGGASLQPTGSDDINGGGIGGPGKKPGVITHLALDRGVSLGSYELVQASQQQQQAQHKGPGHKLEKVIEIFSNYDDRSSDGNDDDGEETGTEEGDSSESGLNGAYHSLGTDNNIHRVGNNGSGGVDAADSDAAQTASDLPPPIPCPPDQGQGAVRARSFGSFDRGAQDIAATSSGWPARLSTDGSEPLVVFHPHNYHPHHGGVMDIAHPHQQHHPHVYESFDEMSLGGGSTATDFGHVHPCAGEGSHSWGDACRGCRREFACHWSEFWREMYGGGGGGSDEDVVEGKNKSGGGGGWWWLDKFLLTCELPFTVLRKLTIPIPCDGYYSRPLVALSTALSPVWLVFYLKHQFGVDLLNTTSDGQGGTDARKLVTVALLFLVPALTGLLLARYAPSGDVPPRSSVSVPLTLWGFLISATWLDLIADQLVGLLSYFGIICRIPSTVMGLTVLAWGNSLQDMLANITVARKGLSNMAITACFAGPIFNVLVGLGVGFAALLNMTGREEVPVELTPPLRMGFLFSVVNGATVIAVGLLPWGGRSIPKFYGAVAMGIYAVYAVASLVL